VFVNLLKIGSLQIQLNSYFLCSCAKFDLGLGNQFYSSSLPIFLLLGEEKETIICLVWRLFLLLDFGGFQDLVVLGVFHVSWYQTIGSKSSNSYPLICFEYSYSYFRVCVMFL